jgi:octaprenyl-diphosphate synthase
MMDPKLKFQDPSGPMTDILTSLAPLADRINQTLADLIARDSAVVARIGGYSFQGGGKRLRPLVFCLVAAALGLETTPAVMTTGAAFEFLHQASLLHDDIIDLAEVRRGRAAAHLAFGVPETVLAGDYLLAKASRLVAELDNPACLRILARLAGTMALGELAQLGARRQVDIGAAEYFRIIYRKTAVLLEGAAKCAALLAGAGAAAIAAAGRYGRKLGLAFQIADDLLDYQGDEASLGKPVGHDLEEGKITLPFILAREALPPARRERLRRLAGPAAGPLGPEARLEIHALVAEGQGLASARRKAEDLAARAAQALALWPPSPAREQLAGLAGYVTARSC